ncbi:antitoxin Xre/MbcA/ParS-like domain-containing protein [Aminobacter sp. LjRoot7]|uniref:antitoxin Xre/MbcA/ParS-like domain-containing protein n=1 Tax=Aminobacter sp. LjRoot7 TaxID=3342335 RepID=UPI003ED0A680
MSEDIYTRGITLVNKYTEFFFSELKNILAVGGESTTGWPPAKRRSFDAVARQAATQLPSSISPELPDLASQFIRALAAEASRQCVAGEGGDPGMLAQPATLSTQGQARGGDLDSMTIEEWAGRVAGATYLEENLRIPRSTLHRWFRCNEVIALRKGRQRHVFPLAQFVDGRPASGIRDVLAHITHPRQAWHWMIHPSPVLNGRIPIDLLKQDLVGDVVSAAKEHSLAS